MLTSYASLIFVATIGSFLSAVSSVPTAAQGSKEGRNTLDVPKLLQALSPEMLWSKSYGELARM